MTAARGYSISSRLVSPINAYTHLCNWVEFASKEKGHECRDDDYVFPALTGLSKKVLKDDGDATG
jgi:hypothetical protein